MTLAVAQKGHGIGRLNLAEIYEREIRTTAKDMRSTNIGTQVMGKIEFERLEYTIKTDSGLKSSERKKLLCIFEQEKSEAERFLAEFSNNLATIAEKEMKDASIRRSGWPYLYRD